MMLKKKTGGFFRYLFLMPFFGMETYFAYQGRTFGLVALYSIAFVASIGLGLYLPHHRKPRS